MENQSGSDQEDDLDGDMQYFHDCHEGYMMENSLSEPDSNDPAVDFAIAVGQPTVDFHVDQLDSESSESEDDQPYDSVAYVALDGIGDTLAELDAPDKWVTDCAEPDECDFQEAELSPIQPDALQTPATETPGPTDQARWAHRVQMMQAKRDGKWDKVKMLELKKAADYEEEDSDLMDLGSDMIPANITRQGKAPDTTGYAMLGDFVDTAIATDPESRAALLNSSCDCDGSIDLQSEGSDHEVLTVDAERLQAKYKRLSSKDERQLVVPLTVIACSNQQGDLLNSTNSDVFCEPAPAEADFR